MNNIIIAHLVNFKKNLITKPKKCVVGKCGAVNSDGVSLHKFSKEEKI